MLHNRFLHWLELIYSFIILIGSNLQTFFLLYMRLTWGHQFFMTGLNKLHHLEETIQFFIKLNIPHADFYGPAVAIAEMVGGVLLFFGLASRLAAIPLIVITITALTTAHSEYLTNFRFVTEPLMLVLQQPYPFLITSIMVFTFGPGRVSLDAWIKRWIEKQPRY